MDTSVHMRDDDVRTLSLCGQPSVSLADHPDEVTCKRCLTAWFGVEEGEDR